MCENAGYGATSAAPIASLLIEKYLRDTIAGADRKAKIEQLANMDLIPPQMKRLMIKQEPTKKIPIKKTSAKK
jgi:penicillin-binding protein 2